MVWWLAGLTGLLGLLGYAVRREIRRRREGPRDPSYLPLYLDNDAVMGLFKLGNYRTALRREVEERRIRNAGCLAVIPLVSLLFRVTGGSSTEVVAKYVEKSEPISVIGLLLSVLRQGDALVEVRLRADSGTLTPNRALLRELARTGAAAPAAEVPLSEVGEFVMVTGRFEASDPRGGTLVMRAPYGDGGPAAHLRVVLRADGLLTPDRELPEGQFQAHCLGKVTSWDPRAREIVLQYPVAVFR